MSESIIFEVVSKLEIIQNTSSEAQSKDLIKDCYTTLLDWKAKENDETELELHAELWARLAVCCLALKEESNQMYKYSVQCVEKSLSLLNPNSDLSKIQPTRLRWYSLADYLYSATLMKMLNQETQEKESQEKLLLNALHHAVEAAFKGAKANINVLVLDASKQI